MQKKILLLFIAMHGAMIQATGTPDLEYSRQQNEAYQKALVNALAGNEKAIDEEDQKNKKANDDEEAELRKEQYDGTGYWVTEPSINSAIGRKFYEYAQYKQAKNKIDQEFSEDARQKKDLFNKEVLSILEFKMEANRFFVVNNCLSALHECGADVTCYDEKGLSSKIFTDDTFGAKYEQRAYVSGSKIATEKGIVLTPEEIKAVVAKNPQTKEFVEGMRDGIDKLSEARNTILTQKK